MQFYIIEVTLRSAVPVLFNWDWHRRHSGT